MLAWITYFKSMLLYHNFFLIDFFSNKLLSLLQPQSHTTSGKRGPTLFPWTSPYKLPWHERVNRRKKDSEGETQDLEITWQATEEFLRESKYKTLLHLEHQRIFLLSCKYWADLWIPLGIEYGEHLCLTIILAIFRCQGVLSNLAVLQLCKDA